MVYMSFPTQLTEQEKELKQKFAKLKKLKKQIAASKLNTTKAEDVEKANAKRTNSETAGAATEQAKMLFKSGAIKLDPSNKAQKFKRARVDRGPNAKESEKQSQVTGYKPYTVTEPTDDNQVKNSRPSLRDSFVPASLRDQSVRPIRGPRVYVRGEGITEKLIREHFSKAGSIVDISMENNRHSGFVTYDTVESADEAVSQFNNSLVGGIKLEVEIARRQRLALHNKARPPDQNTTVETTVEESKHTPSSSSQTNSTREQRDNRDLVTYEDNLFD